MANSYFQFKQFTIHQDKCAMKVTTDGCLFGGWLSEKLGGGSREAGARSQDPIAIGSGVRKILDIGTGTGLLSLMIAQKNDLIVHTVEIDKDAFEQASLNVSNSPWPGRVKVIHGDIKEIMLADKYDVIISNPPFYENELKGDDTKKNLAHHNNGLLITELLHIIKKYLKPGGSFYLLIPYKRDNEIKKLLTDNDLEVRQLTFVRQTINHDYFRIMLQGKLKTNELTESTLDEISIKDDNDKYTSDFANLLKDYYLHL
ncbi:MAG: methyltransferase [Ferruginibacter sp.]|nr:methyltransferase [Chitinophagaceae bacterium]